MQQAAPSRRDHRVDFLRGFALASIFINHVPDNFYEHWTHKNFGASDAAEIFVMLAGFASAYAYYGRYERGERWDASIKAWRRAGVLYMSHIVTTIAGIAIFCAAALYFALPGYLDDSIIFMNTKPLMDDPMRGFLGVSMLAHQLGYFNILPMYMGLLLMVPLIMLVAKRWGLTVLFWTSLIAWMLVGYFVFDLPNYPGHAPRDAYDLIFNAGDDGWYFNPFAWQVLFVIGLIIGQRQRENRPLRFNPWLFALAAAYVVICYWWKPLDLAVNALLPYFPKTLLAYDKTYVAVPRLLHVLALGYVVMMSPLGRWMWLIPKSNFLTAMGRHSLPVFCAGTLLSMMGAVARHQIGDSLLSDTIIVVTGLAIQGALARALDGRKPTPPAPRLETVPNPASRPVADVI
ncbi:OpgC domain-containing protein [soil metagenome]